MANTSVERYNDVDTAEVPSAAWGWSKLKPRTWYALGIFIILFLLGMLHGNHIGHVEDYVLVVTAGFVAFAIIRDMWMRKRGLLK